MREGWIKAAAFGALRLSGALALRERYARGVPILAYHGVLADADAARDPLHNRRRQHVPRARFESHLRYLVSQRQPLALSRLIACLSEGRDPPERAVVLTFDDGYRNVLTQALPLLRELRVPATVFVVTGAVDQPFWQDRVEAALEATARRALAWSGRTFALDTPRGREQAAMALLAELDAVPDTVREERIERLLTALDCRGSCAADERTRLRWDEVRALRDGGLEIGSHADLHEPLTRRAPHDAAAALAASRDILARELGAPPAAISYPYGACDRALARAAHEVGYACALTSTPHLVQPRDDLFQLGRVLIGADDDLLRLRAALSGLRGVFRRDVRPARA